MGNKISIYVAVLIIAFFASGAFANDIFIYQGQYRGSAGRADLPFNLSNPTAITITDDGLMYVGDSMLGAVYSIDPSTDKVLKMIGKSGGASSFTTITDVQYIDKKVYASDRSSNKIYEYVDGSGLYDVGPVSGIVFAPAAFRIENKTMWILNSENDRLIQYDMEKKEVIAQHLQSGIGTGRIKGALDFDMDEKYVYIADTQNNRVEVFTRDMQYYATIGSGKGGVELNQPKTVAVDNEGRIFVADSTSKIIVFDINSNVLATFGQKGNGTNELNSPTKIRFSKNQTLYVADSSNKRIIAYALNWSAGKEQIKTQIDDANLNVQNYQEQIIDVMNKLKIEYSAFTSLQEMKNAYDMYDKNMYGEAKKYALKATDAIANRKLMDEQLLNVKFGEVESNISFALGYYEDKLSLEDEKNRVQQLSLLDQLKVYIQEKKYSQAYDISAKITSWLTKIEEKYDQQKNEQNQNENPTPIVQDSTANEKIALIKNQRANLEIKLQQLQQKANELEISASFETIQTLIETSKDLADMNAYDDAQNSLDNAKTALNQIETTINQKEIEVKQAKQDIERAFLELEAMGIAKNSQNEFAIIVAQAYNLSTKDPQEAQKMTKDALERAREQTQGQSSFAMTLAAFFGAFVAVVLVGAVVAFYIMKRNPTKKSGGLQEVKIEFAKKESEKNSPKK